MSDKKPLSEFGIEINGRYLERTAFIDLYVSASFSFVSLLLFDEVLLKLAFQNENISAEGVRGLILLVNCFQMGALC